MTAAEARKLTRIPYPDKNIWCTVSNSAIEDKSLQLIGNLSYLSKESFYVILWKES